MDPPGLALLLGLILGTGRALTGSGIRIPLNNFMNIYIHILMIIITLYLSFRIFAFMGIQKAYLCFRLFHLFFHLKLFQNSLFSQPFFFFLE